MNDSSSDWRSFRGARHVRCIKRDEYHYAAGGLLAFVGEEKRLNTYHEFAESDDVDLAYRIGPDGHNGAFLYFRLQCE